MLYDSATQTARAAFERGDPLLQLALPLVYQAGRVVPMVGGEVSTRREDASTTLNRVARQGWALVSTSVVFVQTGEVSRDKFFSSGQNVAISGEVVGYYLFSRDEAMRRDDVDSQPVPRRRAQRRPGEVTPLAPLPPE